MKTPKIPAQLLSLKNGCGPVCVWLALRHCGKKLSAEKITRLCGYTSKGTFAICIAVALKRCGVNVAFYTEEDDARKPREIKAYRAAARLGIPILPALTIAKLRSQVKTRMVIVLFNAHDGQGHFSPIRAIDDKVISFTHANETVLSLRTFNARWRAPDVCRQAIVVG
jgi:hypothetical protein